MKKLDLLCDGDVTLPPEKKIGADDLLCFGKDSNPPDVTIAYGEVNDEEEKDSKMMAPKSSIDDMLTEGNLNYYDLLGCTISLTVTMIGMYAEIIKAVDMHGKLPDGWSPKFDCEDSAVSKLDARGQGTAADGVNEEVEAIPNDVKALDVDSTDILDPGGAGKLLFVSGIWRKLVQANEDDLDFAHVTYAVDDR